MRRSHPTAFVLKKRDGCAVCNNIAPCPVCSKGQQCQQIFRSSCQDCPVNKCVAIPGYTAPGGANKSALGGGLAALVVVAIGGAFAFWFWRRLKAKRRRIALHEDAIERRERVKNEKEAMTLQLGGGGGGGANNDPTSPFAIVDENDLDGDTEYTQVTGVLNDQDRLGSLAEPTAFRRRSFGAATHLSRITEGVEEEEEEDEQAANSGNAGSAGRKRNTVGSIQSNARSLASGAGPRVSIGSGTSFGSHNIIPIAFKPPSNHAVSSDGASGYQSLSPLPLPSTAHRATGAPAIQVNTARQGPVRPTRAPDLNLRLPDTQRHQPATSSPLANASTAAKSDTTAAASVQPAYEFMSIDPVEALQSSGPYTRSSDRRLSGATINTINTINSTHSGSLSYVLSAPQVITPVSGEGVRRVQLGNGGKAQLVKVPSLKRKDKPVNEGINSNDDPFRDPLTAPAAAEDELLPPTSNRFGKQTDSSYSTSTLGIPFGDNPFGPAPFATQPPNQTSPSDAADRSSWLGGGAATTVDSSVDPFQDPHSRVHGNDDEQPRASIGGLSLLGQFPFDFSESTAKQMPQDALERVEQYK